MAQGYSRATGKPHVILVTSGPGATDLVIPMMGECQVKTELIELNAFQEVKVMEKVVIDVSPASQNIPRRPSAIDSAIHQVRREELKKTIDQAAKLIDSAKRPVVYTGQNILSTPEGPQLVKDCLRRRSLFTQP